MDPITGGVNLAPLINELQNGVVAVLGVVIAAAVTWLSLRLKEKFNVQISQTNQQQLVDAAGRAVAFGISAAREKYGLQEPILNLRNEVLARATQYLVNQMPDALARAGATPAAAASLVEARLAELLHLPAPAAVVALPPPVAVPGGDGQPHSSSTKPVLR